MPSRTPDIGVQRFDFRPGQEIRRLRGVNRSADPASIPVDQFHLLANVRLTPAGMTDRPGLVQQSDFEQPGAGCIPGMIEVDQVGVGITMTPSESVNSFMDHVVAPSFGGNMQLAIFDQEKAGTIDYGNDPNRNDQRADFRRYNDIDLDDPPKGTISPVNLNTVDQPIPRSGSVRWDELQGTFVSLFKYRKRLFQFGTRQRAEEDDDSDIRTWACIWEVKLPSDEEGRIAGYDLYQDLWELTGATLAVSDAVTTFARADDLVTGEERINEVIYIGRKDGRVFSWDGTTLQEEVSMGGNYIVRLGVFNGLGILAVGSDAFNTPPTNTEARFLDAPGGSWTTITISDILQVTDIESYGGALYLTSNAPDTNPGTWAGARIYKFDGTALTNIFEFSDTPADQAEIGLLFVRRGILNLFYLPDRSDDWKVYRRVADNTWTAYPSPVNSCNGGDFPDTEIYWVLVLDGDRVIIGGLWYSEQVADQYVHAIEELSVWDTSSGPSRTTLYFNNVPTEEGPGIGTQALAVTPEDVALNEEEF